MTVASQDSPRSIRGSAPLLASLLAALFTCFTAAQAPPRLGQPQNLGPGGSVTGRVLCADTQRPARFAQVLLIPTEEATSTGPSRESFGRRAAGRTDLDGAFTVNNVQPGDYYVAGSATGYVSEASLLMAAGADQASALSRLPTVHVSAGSPSTVNLSLERGGVISGRVQWDDGSPAAGVQVNVISATTSESGQMMPGGPRMIFGGFGDNTGGQTDDRGMFRITGLAPGTYLVRSMVQAPVPVSGGGGPFGRNASIVMYAPGKVRRSEAQAVTVRAGEERADLQMTLDLTALHRVTGHVSAASGTVGSGTVRLTDSQDTSLSRTAQINADGSYTLNYVPMGTYTLSVPYASSSTAQAPGQGNGGGRGGQRPSSSFQPFSETLSVTSSDLTGVDVTLNPATSASSQ